MANTKSHYQVTTPDNDEVLLYINGSYSERRAHQLAEETLDSRPLVIRYVQEDES